MQTLTAPDKPGEHGRAVVVWSAEFGDYLVRNVVAGCASTVHTAATHTLVPPT
jgi:hypothetical protein